MSKKFIACAIVFWSGFGLILWQANWIVAIGSLLLSVGTVAHNKSDL